MVEPFILKTLAERGLTEDLIYGDRTTETLFPRPVPAEGNVIAKEQMTVAGLDLFQAVFAILDPSVFLVVEILPGQEAQPGNRIGRLIGDGRALLKGERTALNFLQHLSGVATLTRQFVNAVAATQTKIVDTRKTLPGLRALEKEAVVLGGGYNHRFHLGDLILIKDNHITLAGGIVSAVKATRATLSHPLKIEVETQTIQQVKEAIKSGAEIIMLDNMSIPMIQQAVALIRKSPAIEIEVSGGVCLTNVAAIAKCGVDMISVGAITHSAKSSDINLDIIHDERTRTKRTRSKKNRV
jgi:nicotinate-nucleotide pyrophosphorylase (carboxylating)